MNRSVSRALSGQARWASIAALTGNCLAKGAPAGEANVLPCYAYRTGVTFLAGDTGNMFDNMDYDGQSQGSCQGGEQQGVDWPVDLVFWGNVTRSSVKAVVGTDFPTSGSTKYAAIYNGGNVYGYWDSDDGIKQYDGAKSGDVVSGCGHQDSFHFRVYSGMENYRESMYSSVKGGYFVVATSHDDSYEGCSDSSGLNRNLSHHDETDEAAIASDFASWNGYNYQQISVAYDVYGLANWYDDGLAGPYPRYNDGLATSVHIS